MNLNCHTLFIGALFLLSLLVTSAKGQRTQIELDRRAEETFFANRLCSFLPTDELFINKTFETGYVTFENGKQTDNISLNYNTLFSRMVYLSGDDTVYLDNNKLIKYISTNTNRFYFHPKWGYLVIMAEAKGTVYLAMQKKLEIRRRTQLEPHENPPNVNSREFFSVIYHPKSVLLKREQVLLKRKTLFLLVSKTDEVYVANSSGFKKLFPEKKGAIDKLIRKRYAERNRLRFDRLEDVATMFALCSEP